jgi:carbonyl reductase 1
MIPPSSASSVVDQAAGCVAGRVALVTGANKGIGYFIALQLGLSGMFQHLILACRDVDRGNAAVASIQEQLRPTQQQQQPVQVSYAPLTLGDPTSHRALQQHVADHFGKIDVLVNNAAIAYKGSDPTPFEQQCKPTLDVNFRGTVDLTEVLLPLLRKGQDARLVNVASMAGRLSQLSPQLQSQFNSPTLTMPQLHDLVNRFEHDVLSGQHKKHGWGNSNYGMSKLAVIAATKIWAREEGPAIAVNCCCPGWCRTDMSSGGGTRSPEDGARNAVIPATMPHPPTTGEFFENFKVSKW